MFFIIWGTRARTKTVSTGTFNCPFCGTHESFAHRRVSRWFTFYFIPIFPIKEVGEYVECERCHQPYRTEVLAYQPEAPALAMKAS